MVTNVLFLWLPLLQVAVAAVGVEACTVSGELKCPDETALFQSGVQLNRGLQRHSLMVAEESGTNIINGSVVQDSSGKYPFFALPTSGGADDAWLGCGASIISPTWGMTAAHCFGGGLHPCQGNRTRTPQVTLWMGDLHLSQGSDGRISGQPQGKHFSVGADVLCHDQFDGKCSHGHDIALLRLHGALPSWVKPVQLDLGGSTSGHAGGLTTNIGFGYTESQRDPEVIAVKPSTSIRKANLTIFDDEEPGCARVYAGGYGCSDDASVGPARNKHQQLCAGASGEPQRDTCSGDSGSPMLDERGVQIGIVSYGGGPGEKLSGSGRLCADPNYMGVYSRVSALSDFIQTHVRDLPRTT